MTKKAPSTPLALPIDLSSTFSFEGPEALAEAVATGSAHLYTRWSNPTLSAVEERIAELEGGSASFLCSSGMAAISLALFSGIQRGGTLLVQDAVYGGTHELTERLLRGLGVAVERAPVENIAEAAGALPPNSAIHLETPTNPLLRLVDINAVRQAAPEAQISVDATFASPALLRPLALGADIVVHSATKYLGGHHDVIAGVVTCRPGLEESLWNLRKVLGPTLDPAAAYRVWRGLDTLSLRVRKQTETALDLAHRLHVHPAVERVHHPSLPTHPDHALWDGQGVGGVFSFELAAPSSALKVATSLKRFKHAASLGGVHSLVTLPATVTHAGLTEDEKRETGIGSGLLRLAIGVEDADVLWTDLSQALDSVGEK